MRDALRATDDLKLASDATIVAVRAEDMLDAIGPAYRKMPRARKLRAIVRCVDEGVVRPTAIARGRNKVLLQGIAKTIDQWMTGTPYRFTHLDVGSSSTAPDENQTGVLAHVDASPTNPRLPITTQVRDGKILRTQTFVASSEYVGATLREAALCDAPTGGTPYNRVLFTTPLVGKAGTDQAVINVDHTLAN